MGPLQGLRVIEVAGIGPGPMACMLLADQGAQVLRIDRTEDSGLGVPMAPRHDVNARGRRSLALDLKQPAGVAAALRLIDGADVLVEGFRPGVAERLGIGPETCLARNPALVYGRMTGWGQTGPLAAAAGHDLNYIALAGALDAIGPAGGAPVPPLNYVGDYGGGALYLAFGILAALYERQHSGCGQVVDAAMVDGAASMSAIFHGLRAAGRWDSGDGGDGGDGGRGTNLLDGGAPFYACYRCADGRFVAVGAVEPKFFAAFAQGIALDARFVAAQYDRSQWPAMREAIAALLARQPREHWAALFEGRDACVSPVLSFAEAPAHPHAAARGAYIEVAGVVQPAPAPRFSRSQAVAPRPAPEPGADSDAVLAAAGFGTDEIAALRRQGVVR